MPQLRLSPLLVALRAGGKRDAEEIFAAIKRLDELLGANRS
jgi:hypothetical protein